MKSLYIESYTTLTSRIFVKKKIILLCLRGYRGRNWRGRNKNKFFLRILENLKLSYYILCERNMEHHTVYRWWGSPKEFLG